MRLLDYQRYDVEVGDGYVFFEAPLRDKPSGNRLERAYQRMVRPMPGLTEADAPRLALHLHLPEHDDRPLSRPGQRRGRSTRSACDRTHDVYACYRAGEPERGDARRSSASTTGSTTRSPREDADLVARVQAGHGHARLAPRPARRARGGRRLVRRPRAPRPGGVRRVTRPAPPPPTRASASWKRPATCSPRKASTTSASPGSRPSRASRRRSSTTTSPRARRCSTEALEHSFELLGDLRTTAADDEQLDGRASGWAG